MKSKLLVILGVVAAMALYAGFSSFYMLREGENALVVRLGAPIAVIKTAGLKFKAPFIDSVIIDDSRLQLLAPPPEDVILGDQKRIMAQFYVRFRIVDPLLFYQSLQHVDEARLKLTKVVSTDMRREFGVIKLPDLLSLRRREIMEKIHADVHAKFAPLGVDVEEVRLHRADLPIETSQAIYKRMRSERQREAKELRAEGNEWAQQIEGRADRERTVMLSQAQRYARITRGQGDAEASRILAKVEKGDPNFYKFYRSLQSYRQALADSRPVLLLSPEAAFLKALKSGPAAALDKAGAGH